MTNQYRHTLDGARLEDVRSYVAMYDSPPRRFQRVYEGEASGTNVASWLNGEGGRNSVASRKRVVALLENLRKILAIVASMPSDFDWDNAGYGAHPPEPEGFDRLTTELAYRLQEYPTCPFFSVDVGRKWFIDDGVWGNRPSGESVAAHSIFEIAKAGLLDRIKQCDCGRWYFARFRHQCSCSTACRRRVYEKTQSFKAKRRKYMRKYYHLKNSGKVK